MKIDPAKLDELKQKYPDDVHRLGVPKGIDLEVYVKTPSAQAWDRMQDRVLDPKSTQEAKRAAAHNVLLDCLLWPSREELVGWLEKKPGLLQSLSNQLLPIAGMDGDLSPEKL